MAKDNSFDIVSEVELHEVDNAIAQALKEIKNRYDFKGSISNIERNEGTLTIHTEDEFKLQSVIDVLQSKLIKRNVSLKALQYEKIEAASGSTVRQNIKLAQGIEQEHAKKITKLIKDSKLKIQVQIQGDQLRVSGKSRDDLQQAIKLIQDANLNIPLQFVNFR